MPLYMYQAAYTSESWAAQLKNPQNRVEVVGRTGVNRRGQQQAGRKRDASEHAPLRHFFLRSTLNRAGAFNVTVVV